MRTAEKYICLVLCTAVLMLASACHQINSTDSAEDSISFVDDDGVRISLEAPAERVISLYSAHTENLYYLGAGSRMIGGYKTCVFPPEAAFLDMYDYSSDPENIIAADPDLVLIRPFISRRAPDFVDALRKAGICVVSLYPDSFDEFDDYINKLAALTGTEERAAELLAEFHSELDAVTELTAAVDEKQRVFFESTETNIRTVTDDSMAGRAIKLAGGINIAADEPPAEEGSSIAEFGVERVLENADGIDVYISQRGSMNSGGNLEAIEQRPGFDTIKAVKEGRVYLISEKLVSSPSFRYVKGVHELARFMYPELMDNYDGYRTDETAVRRQLAELIVMHEHMPIYLPSSSSYYSSEHKGHTFGLFEDVSWQDRSFDYIETAVNSGAVEWFDMENGEYFYPENNVTREELAEAVFILGDFSAQDDHAVISDIDSCSSTRIVQTLVDNGVFGLNEGKFEPKRVVSCNEIIAALDRL